jgi:RNA polymerase sigma factor (sigma-70 family)
MRERLVAYFDRKNCFSPDELADETLNRVARRLEEQGKIDSESPAKFCYTIARYVFLEYLRSPTDKHVPLDELTDQRRITSGKDPWSGEEAETKERMLDCLEHCTEKLEAASRTIIVGYYFGEQRKKIENRRSIAETLGISMNALSIRACRIRNKLENCVGQCLGAH